MSTTAHPLVILYGYETSAFYQKVQNVLMLKQIPYKIVKVLNFLPRPEITDLLGVKYRRIPILAIGNDIYCDSNAIIPALERRFPPSQGYGTVFPSSEDGKWTDTGMIKAFSKFYADAALFPPALGLLPWNGGFPEELVKDRGDLYGTPIDVQKFAESSSIQISTLSTHLSLIEEQLADGRKYLFPTRGPSLADISVHFVLDWACLFPAGKELLDTAPATKAWAQRISEELARLRDALPRPEELTGAQAADLIKAAEHESYSEVGFDGVEAERLGLHEGMQVKVSPEDTGRAHPSTGKLVALGKQELTIEVIPREHSEKGDGVVRVHFPRLSFSIRSPDALEDNLNFKILQ